MPHEVYGEKAVYAINPAWHRIGTVLDDCFTAEQALQIINPERVPVQKWVAGAKDPITGEWYETEEFAAVVQREDGNVKIYQFPSPDYGVVQDWEQLSFMDEIVRNVGGAHYEAAVRLRGGRQTILTIDLGQVTLDEGERADVNYRRLFGGNSHDGSWGLLAKMTNVRAECANMAAMVMRGASPEFKTRHTTNIRDRVAVAQQALGLAVEWSEVFYSQAETMIHTPMSDNSFKRILDTIFVVDAGTGEKDEDAIGTVRGIYELNPSQIRLYGTMWGGFNAVSYFSDWNTKVRGGKVDVGTSRFMRQFDDTKGIKQKAWDVFTEAVK